MSLNEEIKALRNIPMFANMEMTQLKLLAFTSQRLAFEPGQDIFCRGEEGDAAYIIIDGSADVLVDPDGTEMTLATVVANARLGELALLFDVPRTATARAKTCGPVGVCWPGEPCWAVVKTMPVLTRAASAAFVFTWKTGVTWSPMRPAAITSKG